MGRGAIPRSRRLRLETTRNAVGDACDRSDGDSRKCGWQEQRNRRHAKLAGRSVPLAAVRGAHRALMGGRVVAAVVGQARGPGDLGLAALHRAVHVSREDELRPNEGRDREQHDANP